ncbi:MAG: hypothetical protein M1830_007462 [Pleopsidium flavum]|nr:MAG: hypothetical protein M1830_007462 [Pleopsidium flavum]
MAGSSEGVREGVERAKFRSGLKSKRQNTGTLKRKRDDDEGGGEGGGDRVGSTGAPINSAVSGEADGHSAAKKKKRTRGPKGPNPLSIKKPKTAKNPKDDAKEAKDAEKADLPSVDGSTLLDTVGNIIAPSTNGAQIAPSKRRRKRKHKSTEPDDPTTPDQEAQDL